MSTLDLDKLAQRVPRYTSYPPAPYFEETVTSDTYTQWLGSLKDGKSLSLYFHVPFCKEMCWYCGCNTIVVNRPDIIKSYVQTMRDEVERVSDAIGARIPFQHLHFGGGTPTMLESGDFAELMAFVHDRFTAIKNAELAVEIDPRSLTPAMAETLADVGINRASLGVQEFSPVVQKAVNRVQPFEVVKKACELLRANDITRIGFDLMIGLPHQTVDDIEHTIEKSMWLQPDRISVFAYAHVPWMKKHQRLIDDSALPKLEERLAQADAARTSLGTRGYQLIGMDHFARPFDPLAKAAREGTLRRNFQGYTTDQADALLGFGASAIGSMPQGYIQNTPQVRDYMNAIKSSQFATIRGYSLSDDDRLRRDIIDQLMCTFTLDLETIAGAKGQTIGTLGNVEELAEYQAKGLIERDPTKLTITEAGKPYVRLIAACFDSYLTPSAARHAMAG